MLSNRKPVNAVKPFFLSFIRILICEDRLTDNLLVKNIVSIKKAWAPVKGSKNTNTNQHLTN